MTIICPVCKYENDDEVEFCTACGAELTSSPMVNPPDLRSPSETPIVSPPDPESVHSSGEQDPFENIFEPLTTGQIFEPVLKDKPTDNQIDTTKTNSSEKLEIPRITGETARLILIDPNSLPKEFPIGRSGAMVGRFDSDSGPVDIDLDELVGGETVSRNHAEIYLEDGQWKVKDLGSENGTFIRRFGQPRFSGRINKPEILNPDDELAFGKVRFIFKSP